MKGHKHFLWVHADDFSPKARHLIVELVLMSAGMEACCLHSESAWSNIHIVLLQRYRKEWGLVPITGRSPNRLFAALSRIRCQMAFETQDVE